MKKVTSPELGKYLTKDEIIEREFNLPNCKVWATNKRLFIKKGRKIQDLDCNHISSVGFSQKRYYYLIALGFFLLILGCIFSPNGLVFIPEVGKVIAIMLYLAGIICLVLGVFLKKEFLELVVLGFNTPIKFEGHKQDLDHLLKIIREKRF